MSLKLREREKQRRQWQDTNWRKSIAEFQTKLRTPKKSTKFQSDEIHEQRKAEEMLEDMWSNLRQCLLRVNDELILPQTLRRIWSLPVLIVRRGLRNEGLLDLEDILAKVDLD